jgi:hypothetical protein
MENLPPPPPPAEYPKTKGQNQGPTSNSSPHTSHPSPHSGSHPSYPPPPPPPPPPPQTSEVVNDYIKQFRKNMRFMNKKEKEDILKEVESHIYEKAESYGELSNVNFQRAISDFGHPKELIKPYKDLYGYSTAFIIGLMIVGFIVSLFTVPFSLPGVNKDLIAINNICLGISTLFTLLIFIFIIYVGKNFGKKPGLLVGISCFSSRVIMLSIIVGFANAQSGDVTITADGGLCLGFGIVSLFMPIVGYFAGRTTFKFKEGFAIME